MKFSEMKLIETCWLDVHVSNQLVAVDDLRSVVGLVTYNQEVVHTTLGLNVTQVRVDVVLEQRASGVVVELEQNRAGHLSNLTLDNEEETADVDTVESRGVTQGGLVTEQDSTFARESNNGVYTSGVKFVALSLRGVVRQA